MIELWPPNEDPYASLPIKWLCTIGESCKRRRARRMLYFQRRRQTIGRACNHQDCASLLKEIETYFSQ